MWVKLDDTFAGHPKVIGLSDAAFRLHVEALCYAGQHLTDGHVPAAWLARCASASCALDLVAAGLWEVVEDGYALHDFLRYNPSRESVEADRSRAAARKERWKERRSERVPNAERTPDGTPTPTRPDPARPEGSRAGRSVTTPPESSTVLRGLLHRGTPDEDPERLGDALRASGTHAGPVEP